MRSLALLVVVQIALPSGIRPAAADNYIWLFKGDSLDAWTTTDGRPVTRGWEVADGAIHLDPAAGGGAIVTARQFDNYDLHFEWRISEGGNSGVKYRVRRFRSRLLGCEYQILDDNRNSDARTPKTSTGSLYDVYAPSPTKYVKPPGQYNHSRVLVFGNCIQHWLNGQRILSVRVGGCDWYRHKADSKFSDVRGFGENRFGRIMLTNHGHEVWYRNIVLRRFCCPVQCRSFAAALAPVPGFVTRTVNGTLVRDFALERRRLIRMPRTERRRVERPET